MKASVYMAVSLDGFIARKNGDLDWLPQPAGSDEDYGYHAFMQTVDALVMGRATFEKVLSFGVDWPYRNKPVIVLSRESYDLPDGLPESVDVLTGDLSGIVSGLLQRGFEHIYLDGGITVQHFLRAGLVDRFILTIIPVLLGEGKPLFGSLPEDISLRLVDHQSWSSGLLQVTYDVIRTNT